MWTAIGNDPLHFVHGACSVLYEQTLWTSVRRNMISRVPHRPLGSSYSSCHLGSLLKLPFLFLEITTCSSFGNCSPLPPPFPRSPPVCWSHQLQHPTSGHRGEKRKQQPPLPGASSHLPITDIARVPVCVSLPLGASARLLVR